MDDTQNSSVDNYSDISLNSHSYVDAIQNEIDGRSYVFIHQSREKCENAFPFLFISEAKNGWSWVCSEYGKGDEFQCNNEVKQEEHPKNNFRIAPIIPKAEVKMMDVPQK